MLAIQQDQRHASIIERFRVRRTDTLHWKTATPFALDLNGPQQLAFRPFPAAWVERPALELFRQIAESHPHRIACQDVKSAMSFAEIWAGARRLAATIDASMARGGAVGILLPNQAAYPVAVLACLAAARPAVLIDRHYPQERVAAIVRDAGLAGIVMNATDIAGGYLLPAGTRALALEDALTGDSPAGIPGGPPPPDAPSFVVYTSGSSGQPKGIVLSQRAVLHRASELVNAVHLRPDDKVLSLASPGTIAGLQQIFEVMLSGASLVKLDLQRLGLGRIVRAVAERGITMMFSTPAIWRSVSRLEGAREMLASLRCVQSSGDTLLKVDYDLIRTLLPADCHVLSVYGATEAPALLQWFVASPPGDEARVPAGFPLPGLDFAVLDEAGQPVADGDEGELVIRSRFTSLGLWQRGVVRRGPLERDPDIPGAKIYRTGDLVRRRIDGLYVVLGRRDRQIKILGNRVELAEIETALRRVPAVLDAAVVARRGERDPLLAGFVVPRRPGDPRFLDEVRRDLTASLPAFMRPRTLMAMQSLPLLPGRKIDEDALLACLAPAESDGGGADTSRVPRAEALRLVEPAWRTVLGRSPPRQALSFEAAGGDSLQFLQLIFELERLAGRRLPIERFHGRLSAREFASELDDCLGQATEVLPADAPAIFLFPPAGGGDADLSAFRVACAARLPLRQVAYPDLRALVRTETSFERVAASTVDQIVGLKPEGRLILAGYSDGGDVAWEAARQLRRVGRDVSRLLILDTDSSGVSEPASPATASPLRLRIGRFARRRAIENIRLIVDRLVPDRLLRSAAGRVLVRLALAMPMRLPAGVAFVVSFRVFAVLFDELHRRWLVGPATPPLDVPVVLFRSQQERPGASSDLGWRCRTTDLTIVSVPGEHATMLEGSRGLALAEAFANLAANNELNVRRPGQPKASNGPARDPGRPATPGARLVPAQNSKMPRKPGD